MRQEQFALALFAIYIFAVSNTVSNALVSISSALILLYTIYDYIKNKRRFPLPGAGFQLPWWSFYLTALAASLLLGDVPSIERALDYIYLSVPFWVLLGFYYYHAHQKAFIASIIATFLLFGGKSIYVFALVNHFSAKRVIAFDSGPNPFAEILITSLPFLCVLAVKYYKKEKCLFYLLGISSIAGIACLLLTASRGGMGGFVAGLIFLGVARLFFLGWKDSLKPILASLVLAAVFGGLFLAFQGEMERITDNQRPLFYESSYAMWQDHKLLGVGLANWEQYYYSQYKLPGAFETNISMPHNSLAFFFSTTGIIGGVGHICFTLGLLLYLCRRMREQPDNYLIQAALWSFFAITAHGMVDTGITMRIILRLFSAYLGITVASIMLHEQNIQQKLKKCSNAK